MLFLLFFVLATFVVPGALKAHGGERPAGASETDQKGPLAFCLRHPAISVAVTMGLLGAGYSNKEIASRLSLSVKNVETYKARSLEKLGLDSRADLVRYALQRGWLQNT